MCYSARANPEDIKKESGFTVREVRGVKRDTFVRLKDEGAGVQAPKSARTGQPLRRPEARRCHGRVVGFCRVDGRRHVKLKECTPELLAAMPDASFHYRPARCLDCVVGPSTNIHGAAREDFEAVLDAAWVEPLRQCRGKSGGMNHAVEVVNAYLHHYSTTMRRVRARGSRDDAGGHLLFAIFDCRHMALEGFWDAVVPQFYRYTRPNNPWSSELEINPKVAFVQLPQTFTGLRIQEDFFDMRNEYLFRMANTVRTGVGAITSCGTNAVWNYPLVDDATPLAHRFNEETMIEDTASSHEAIVRGRKGVYLFKRLVLGARKGTSDYLAAVFRWSKGGVQLAWTQFWYPRPASKRIDPPPPEHAEISRFRPSPPPDLRVAAAASPRRRPRGRATSSPPRYLRGISASPPPRHLRVAAPAASPPRPADPPPPDGLPTAARTRRYPNHGVLYPWLVLIFVVAPIVACVVYFQVLRFDACHRTKGSRWLWSKVGLEAPCRRGPFVGIATHPVFLVYAIYLGLTALYAFKNPRVGANLIMFENITYFFSSQTAYFWLAIPCYMTMAPPGAPLQYDAVTLTIGGLWVELHMDYIYNTIKSWAPLENGKAPDTLSLLRAQQMFFVTAPLHTLSIVQGTGDGFNILFRAKDASRWASFDSINAITTAKVWVLTMQGSLSLSILVGLVRIGASKDDFSQNVERLLGVLMSFVFLCLNMMPSVAMFFHGAATRARKTDSVIDKCTTAVFGRALVLTPRLFYMTLYVLMIFVAVTGISSSEKWQAGF